MEMATLILSYVFSIAVLILLIGLAFHGVAEVIERLHNRFIYYAKAYGKREVGHSLISASYWFSESKETMEALQIIGKQMTESSDGIFDNDTVREVWRNKIKPEVPNE